MGLTDDLKLDVAKIFREGWTPREGQKVPEPEDLKLGNDSVRLKGTVLYADLDASTDLVDRHKPEFAAEVYKTFLHCAARCIRLRGGAITSYDGDRIMAVFIGSAKNSSAAKAALHINHAVTKIINPALNSQYPSSPYTVGHTVGIDTSDLLVARTGVRGANDLVWVGRAANHAAKLSDLDGYPTWITPDVHDMLNEEAKYSDGQAMWVRANWPGRYGASLYGSTWSWAP